MTLIRRIVRNTLDGVDVCDTPEALSALHNRGCAAAIWQRRPLDGFQSWIDRLDPDQLPRARMILRRDAVQPAIQHAAEIDGTPPGPERTMLLDDIAALADIFSRLMAARWLRVRLDVVETNACRKFHIDAVTARLVCTYRGTGTQYGIARPGADPGRVFTVPTG